MFSPYDTIIALRGIYPKNLQTYIHTKTYTWMFVYSSFNHNRQNSEATKMSFIKCMDKLCYIQTMQY